METIELYLKAEQRRDGARGFRVDDSNGIGRGMTGYKDFLETVASLPHIARYKIASDEGISSEERVALDTIVNMKNNITNFKEAQAKTLAILF